MESSIRLTRSASKGQTSSTKKTQAKSRTDPKEADHSFPPEKLSAKKSKVEQKKRRSSFVAGRSRRSLTASNAAVTELHKKVPTDVAPEERLRLLKETCFEYTMDKLQEEFPELADRGDFLKEAQTRFSATLQEMVEDGSLCKICSPENEKPNPVNDEIENSIQQFQANIERFKMESKKWGEILRIHTEEADQAEKSLANPGISSKMPSNLSLQQRKILADLPDLAAVCSWADDKAKRVSLQVDKILQCSQQLKQFQQVVESDLQEKTKEIALSSFTGYMDVSSPQKLIQGALKN